MKKQIDRNKREAEEYRVGDRMLISMKDFSTELIKRAIKKLIKKYIGPYMVRKTVSKSAVKLELLASLRIYLVINVRRIVKYREQIEREKKIPPPPIEIVSEKKYEIKKILDR